MNGSSRMTARQASTRSRSATDLSTYPEAPARRASKKYWSLSYIDSSRMRVPGQVRLVVQDQPNPATDEGVVVGEQDPSGRGRGHRPSFGWGTGTSSRSSVP